MGEIVFDITPPGWKVPQRQDQGHLQAIFRAVRPLFPEAKRIEVNQWGKLVIVTDDSGERQKRAVYAVHAIEVQLYRERLDAMPDGFAQDRERMVGRVDAQHLPAAPAPVPLDDKIGSVVDVDERFVRPEYLSAMSDDELERRYRGFSRNNGNDSSICVECRRCWPEWEMPKHELTCSYRPLLDELERRSRARADERTPGGNLSGKARPPRPKLETHTPDDAALAESGKRWREADEAAHAMMRARAADEVKDLTERTSGAVDE